jgi:DUF4097 and DUF4098 domain-containing protein YvlB
MGNEKMQILKMLEEGKINADEASRLLQSVEAGQSTNTASHTSGDNSKSYSRDFDRQSSTYTQSGSSQTSSSQAGSSHANSSQYGNSQRQGSGASAGFDDFATDLRRKFEVLAKDMEPKIQKFVGTVAEKTADVADMISKNMHEAEKHTAPARTSGTQQQQPPRQPHQAVRPAPAYRSGASPRSFELKVEPGYNELNLKALNGDITITGYNGDKITVNLYAKETRAGARLELMRLGSRYCLNYNAEDFKTISVEALVPDKLFSNVVAGTSNGQTNVSNITTEHFSIQSSGGDSLFRNIHAESIRIDTGGGRLGLDEICAKNANIEGSGGAVDANYLDTANLRLLTSNAGITMNAGDFRQGADYTWIIESSNGKIALNVPSSPRNGYHIKASTSLEHIRLGLPALNYLKNARNNVEAISSGFDSAAVRVKVSVETSNAELSVN